MTTPHDDQTTDECEAAFVELFRQSTDSGFPAGSLAEQIYNDIMKRD